MCLQFTRPLPSNKNQRQSIQSMSSVFLSLSLCEKQLGNDCIDIAARKVATFFKNLFCSRVASAIPREQAFAFAIVTIIRRHKSHKKLFYHH